jgi:hypothetical protein
MKAFASVVMLLLCMCAPAHGQEGLTGKYTGSFVAQVFGRDVDVGLTIVISSVQEGRVTGVATMGGQSCGGDYPFEGYLKGKELGVRSNVKGGRAGDCTFGMLGTLEGNKIVGTMGRYPLQVSK